ncbi:MAG TPA: MDR family MFS transporter [Bacilli bacterium]|nr:MDR family MFS transporter [Bacilli bacterium]
MGQLDKTRPFVITGLLLGLLMASLDNTIVATAMPTIVTRLGGLDIYSWVFSAYLLTSTTFIPIFGKLADLYGKKGFYLLGLILFVLASVLCSTASTMEQLIAYRALQGIGASAMFPISFALIMEIFPPEARGKMQGLFSAVFGISSVAGPTAGAYFTEHLSWHWIFLINLPLGILAAILIAGFLKLPARRVEKVVIDYAGAFTLTLAIIALMFGLVMGGKEYAWDSWQILSLLIGSGVLTLLFLFIETKAKQPVIPLRLFNAGLTSSTGTAFLQGVILITASSYIPLFIQGVIGGSAVNAGNLLTPMMLAVVAGSTVGGILSAKLPFRPMMLIASVFMAGGTYLLSRITMETTNTYMILSMIVLGLGIGPLMPITMMLTQVSVGRENIGIGTSLITFFRNIGMALGVSVMGVIVNSRMQDTMVDLGTKFKVPPQFADMVKEPQALFSEQARQFIPPEVFTHMQQGMGGAIADVFLICVGVAVACFLFSLLAGKASLAMLKQGGPGGGGGPQTTRSDDRQQKPSTV